MSGDQPQPGRDLAKLPLAEALEQFTPELQMALPDHINVDRFKRVVLTAINNSTAQNDLRAADRRSLFNACTRCAQDGLYPDGREAALVVYNTKMRDANGQEYWAKLVQYLPMIAGIRKRMRNTGEVLSATAEVVYENDHFHYQLGDDPKIEHGPPAFGTERGKALGAYAVIRLKNGEIIREVMSTHEIERARAISRAKDSLMWTTFWSEGARKTVLRRAAKAAPTGSDLDRLLGRDEEPPPLPPLDEVRKTVPPRPPTVEAPIRAQMISEPDTPADSEPDGIGVGNLKIAEPEPPPRRRERRAVSPPPPPPPPAARSYCFSDQYGETHEFEDVNDAVTIYAEQLEAAKGLQAIEAMWQNGARLLAALREGGHDSAADALAAEYAQLVRDAEEAESEKAEPETPQSDFDVLVPFAATDRVNQWFMAARERVKTMQLAGRPQADFGRFREANKVPLERLKNEMRSWSMMLEKEITKGTE